MALVKWYDDEEQKKEDLFAPKQITSVQSAWQPTMQNGGSPAKPQSYLMSDEKAQADQELAQRRAAEAQAAAQARAQAAAAHQFAQAQQRPQQQQQQQQAIPTIKNPEQAENDTGWKQFYKEEFNKAKKGQNFVERLMDGGQASRRAELNARTRYTNSLLNRAYDDNGNILDANAAQSAHALAQHNSGVAANNAARTRFISNAIGATHENRDQNVFDRLKSTANAVRNMNLYDGAVGVNDETKFSLDDIGRFGGSLVQGIATAPILAGKSLTEAVTGRGTKADTGLEGELTGIERAGRTISGLLDAVTPFMAGSGQLVHSLATKVMANAATAAERRLLNRMLTAAAEESVLSGSQAGAEYFGQGGLLVDENGEIDVDKLAEFGQQVGMGAGMGAVGGATLSGAATGINRLGRRNRPTPEPDTAPAGNGVALQPASAPGNRVITLPQPLPITNTYVPPRRPAQPAGPTIPERPITPDPQQMTPESQAPKTPEQAAVDEVRQREQAQREQPIEQQTPVQDESVQPIPEVADGMIDPQPVLPDMPETRPEQIRALQEARVGKTQAEEAQINQRLQEAQANAPSIRAYHGSTRGDLQELIPGADTGANERRNLIYLAEDANTAANYAKERGTDGNGIGELRESPTGRVYDVDVEGDILGAYDFDRLAKLADAPGAEKLGRARNHLTNPTGLSADILEHNPELVKFLSDNGITAVRAHLMNGGGNELIVLNPERARLAGDKDTSGVDASVAPSQAAKSTPRIDSNLPDDMTPVGAEPATSGVDIEVLKRGISKIDAPKEMKGRIARAVGKELDTEIPLSEILDDPKVSPWLKDKITTAYNKLEKLTAKENAIQARGIKSVSKGVIPVKDVDLTKRRNSLIAERGRAERNLLGYVKQLEGRVSKTARLANVTENLAGSKNTNQLTSAALLERNATQELGGNIQSLITNPVAFTKGLFGSGSAFKSAGKSALMEWTVTPKVMSDVPRYLIGNLYNTLMTPSTALARHRRGMHADASAEMILKTAGIKNPTQAEIRAYSALQGAENEALVNTMVGVFNGMSSRTQANRASDAFAEFIKTGSEAAHQTFLKNLERQTTLAKSLMDTSVQGLGKRPDGSSSLRHEAMTRIGGAYVNMFLPYLSNVTNLTKTAVSQTLNPLARSTVDQILKSVRSKPENVWAIVKQKSGDYGMLAGVGMMISAGAIGYNDGEEVDKPRGVYIDLGDDRYVPIRATHVEVPVAAAVTAGLIAKDIAAGDVRDAEYYAKIMTASLPYLDSIEQHAGAVNSLVKGSSEEGDNMYGAKAWAINQGRSFVPLSNNSVQQWSARNRGESLNAKKVYDKDMGKWFANSVRQNYDPAFRDSLEDSRDMAGRVRTVDNQGSFVNKTINDKSTKTYSSTIDDLVTYARQNKLGKGTQDMFNTYPDGKNNNFKSVQDKITFLDAPEKDGKKTPDNADKLKPNEKLYDLSQQIYNGFFGDGADELLTLNGEELRSDVAVPGKNNPGKNTNLPISIASIRNAIAQTDLPQEDWDKLNSISEAKSAIAERAKSGEIAWSQYYDALPDFSAQESAILANSPGNQKLQGLIAKLRDTGFFEQDGFGSTRSGQTYLWNSLNAMLGDKGKTPAAQWAESGSGSGFTPWGRGGGRKGLNNILKPAEMGTKGVRWSPVGKRQMASVKTKGYTPFKAAVKLNNAVKRDRTQNYADRSI